MARQSVNQNIPDNNENLIKPADVRGVLMIMLDTLRDNFLTSLNFMDESQRLTSLSADSAASYLSQSIALVAEFQSLVAAGYKPRGNWSIPTNTPDLTAISKTDGDAYIVKGAGSTSITGVSIPAVDGDAFIWNAAGSNWIYKANGHIPADASVSPVKMLDWMGKQFRQLPSGSKYMWVLIDAMNRIGLSIGKDGKVRGKFVIEASHLVASAVGTAALANEAVTVEKLASDVLSLMIQYFDATNSKYWFMIIDAMNRIGLAIKKDGFTFISKLEVKGSLKLPNGSLLEEWLEPDFLAKMPSSAFLRLNSANSYDVDYISDGLVRGVEIPLHEKTVTGSAGAGSAFQELPPVETPCIKGVNDSATSIEIIQNNGMVLRGKVYRGTYDPTAAGVSSGTAGTIGTNDRGLYGNFASNDYPALPSGNPGDFWTMDAGFSTGLAITRQGLTFKHGDLLVKTVSGYAIQAAPGNGIYNIGDYWDLTVTAVFGGIQYTQNERIVYAGAQTNGGPRYARFLPSKPGEYYYKGSATSSAFAPASPLVGDVYDATFAGTITASGLNVAIGDLVFYIGGWGMSESKLKTIPNGIAFHFPSKKASDYSIRRADKSNTTAILKVIGQRGSVPQRVSSDEFIAISDSMLGVNGMASKLALAINRPVTLYTYGGSNFASEVDMMKYNILAKGDTFKGKNFLIMGGQNDGTDLTAIRTAAYRAFDILGSKQRRVIFMSPTGTQSATHNGTRLVVSASEDSYGTNGLNGTHVIALQEQFYRNAFPMQFFNTREALLAAAAGRNVPDLRFPGMTEAQVAATYHILPKSFFYEIAGKPDKTLCNYLGLWTDTVNLPTGGNDNDYYLRTATAGGSTTQKVGNEIIKVAGVWTEFNDDMTHWSILGAQTVADAVAASIATRNI